MALAVSVAPERERERKKRELDRERERKRERGRGGAEAALMLPLCAHIGLTHDAAGSAVILAICLVSCLAIYVCKRETVWQREKERGHTAYKRICLWPKAL